MNEVLTLPYKPLNKRVFVRRDKAAEKKGDIFLPENAKAPVYTGVVHGVADDVSLVKPGDRIIFYTYSGSAVSLDIDGKEEEFSILREDEIAAVEKKAGGGKSMEGEPNAGT